MRLIENECYIQPRAVETIMRNSFNTTMKYQNKLWTRILLERLVMNNIGTKDVVQFADSQAKNSKGNILKIFNSVVIKNMSIKVDDAKEAEKVAKYDMVQRKIELKKVVKENTVAGQEFQQIVNYEWNKHWNIKSSQCTEKS